MRGSWKLKTIILLFLTLFGAVFTLSSKPLYAHELQPASLVLRQIAPEKFEILWRAPTYYGQDHPAKLRIPDEWRAVGTPTTRQQVNSKLHRLVVTASKAMVIGETIYFDGLDATITDVFVRFHWLDGAKTTGIARPNRPWVVVVGQQTSWDVAYDYMMLGIEHILSGFDHLLFVFALLLIIKGWRLTLLTITAFTFAHSITLATSTLGLISLPGPPVEAVIALSIVFLARELIKVNQGHASLTAQHPWAVSFGFGLLHGFGFAGALGDIGLPSHEIPLALLMFNVGVEVGQLAFISLIFVLLKLVSRLNYDWPNWSKPVPGLCVGVTAGFWFIERIVGFFPY